jgi:hypothetical protein
MPYDMLVSFDVEALIPSIPVDESLDILKKWLEEQYHGKRIVAFLGEFVYGQL